MAKKKFSAGLTFVASLLALVIGFAAAFCVYTYIKRPKGGDVYVSGDLSIHFMQLGNNYTGDSIYIKAGDTDILIDAGSRANSTDATAAYIDKYCEDGKLEYVIATHADQDHIAGFAGSTDSPSIFDRYECEVIIDFPRTDKDTQTYQKYCEKRDAEVAAGAKHYTALECWNNENGALRVYDVAFGVEMEILYNYFYENDSSDENNYSVCLMFNQGDKHFLFTGDLEEEGEEYLVEYNTLPEVELFKAGHHGSKTSSNDCLLSVIKPKIVCVCCCAGSVEYTQNFENTFPTQAMIDRVAQYTNRVYVTTYGDVKYDASKGKYVDDGYGALHGDIVVTSNRTGVTVKCSKNDGVLLKDTEWFKENRVTPAVWAAAAA